MKDGRGKRWAQKGGRDSERGREGGEGGRGREGGEGSAAIGPESSAKVGGVWVS